jgi:hypothetical protein
MSVKKNRVRPALVDLEGRVMADAKMVGAFARAVGDLAVARPLPVEVTRMSFAGQSATPVAKPAAESGDQYTAITIKNSTSGPLNYSFRWGNGTWTNYTLTPGQQRLHYIRSLNQVATVAYDKSFAPGVQEQRYTLAGRNIVRVPGLYFVEPIPSVGEGRLYTFKGVPNGVQLYS